jgi:hypothetical protein
MRYLAVLATGAFLIAASGPAAAGPFPAVGLSAEGLASIELVAAKKNETMTQKVKRAWKNLVGYKFDVSCPAFPAPSKRTCSETGSSRDEARSKCISRNSFCWVADSK